jgi:hypothetical protein
MLFQQQNKWQSLFYLLITAVVCALQQTSGVSKLETDSSGQMTRSNTVIFVNPNQSQNSLRCHTEVHYMVVYYDSY